MVIRPIQTVRLSILPPPLHQEESEFIEGVVFPIILTLVGQPIEMPIALWVYKMIMVFAYTDRFNRYLNKLQRVNSRIASCRTAQYYLLLERRKPRAR
jgi:hypothetical protein